jgi:endoglucanase
MHFSNAILAASIAAFVIAAPSAEKRASKFKWFGASESGAEFGNTAIPGRLDKDYTWPVE